MTPRTPLSEHKRIVRLDRPLMDVFHAGKEIERTAGGKRAKNGSRAADVNKRAIYVAEQLGISHTTWARIRRIGRAVEDGSEVASGGVAAFDAGEMTIHEIDQAVLDGRRAEGGVKSLRGAPGANQADRIRHVVALCSELSYVSAQGHAEFLPEEADQLQQQLAQSLTGLRRLLKQLRRQADA